MIPYFYYPTVQIGPFALHSWGVVVAIGMGVGLAIARGRMKRAGLNVDRGLDLAFWILVAALLFARLFHVFVYDWAAYQSNPIEILKIWKGGLSSFGGYIGAAIAGILYTHKHKLPFWEYADAFMFGWPLAQSIARIGCFLNHLHVGKLSTLPIAVAFPEGARLDMGLLESLVLFAYGTVAMTVFPRRKHFTGFYLVAAMIFYGVARFVLDFWRATDIAMPDTRYLGLTPAQYGSLALVFLGIYFWRRKCCESSSSSSS